MANIKLKNANGVSQTYKNVNIIKVKDTNDNDVPYIQADGIVVSFIELTGSPKYAVYGIAEGTSIQAPQEPARAGYIFRGWSLVSHEYIQANKVAFPYLPTENTTLYAMWEQKAVSGTASISGLGSELLTGVSFNVSEGFLDNLTQITDDNGDVWIEIPTCYRKITALDSNGQITGKIVSFTKVDDSYVPYSVFKKPNGDLMPYVRIGKYCIKSGTKAESKASGTVQSMNIGAGRELARARGNGYQIYDWQFRELFNDLAMISKQSVQINDSTIINISEWNNGIWIDGFCQDTGVYRVCSDPTKYVDNPTASSDGYTALSYEMPKSTAYIVRLGYDSNVPFANFPSYATGGSSATYYPDQQYYAAGNHPVTCYVGFTSADDGLFLFYGYRAWSLAGSCRLCYRPV